MSTDVFISYSTRDTDTAQALCTALEAAGLSCWIAPRNIMPGETWSESIIDGINGCQVMVLLYTSASNASPQVLREVERAVSKRLGLVAFRAENVNPSKALEYLISVSHWLEAYTGPMESHLTSLVKSVQSLLAARTGRETFPSPGLPPVPTPSATSPALPPHNLPEQLTTFIGRKKQREEVRGLLRNHRLVTLTGTGGTGKTRLALQIGADLLPEYQEGIWLVELAPLTDPSLVTQTVATALGIREEPDRPLLDTLTDSLQSKTLMLLLDNCEHVLEVTVILAQALVKRCPRVRILATSRERLAISGEQTYRVPPLSVPQQPQTFAPETLHTYESVRLFVDRAVLCKPDFALTAQVAPALASVCHRLDGIPLAIELAAVRLRGMPLEEIDRRLEDRFLLLTGGDRSALPRQRTLRGLLDWSYDLLNETERVLLHRLSVFAGGWTLEAAEKVCSGAGIEEWEVLDLLLSLSDKSLVMYEEIEGQARYHLLETIRQYAREKLAESGEAEEVRRRHQDCFLALAEEAEPQLRRSEQAVWFQRLDMEHDNLRAALDGEEKTDSLRIAEALSWFWYIRGYYSEGRARLSVALREVEEGADTAVQTKALNSAGILAWAQSDYEAARALFEQSLAIKKVLGDRRGIAVLLNNLGNVAREQGHYEAASTHLEESLAILKALGDKPGIAATLNNLGILAKEQGNYEAARDRE